MHAAMVWLACAVVPASEIPFAQLAQVTPDPLSRAAVALASVPDEKGAAEAPSPVGSAAGSAAPTAELLQPPQMAAPAANPSEPSSTGDSDGGTEERSPAERIARLERSIQADEGRLAALETELHDPQSEHARAHAEFRELDEALDRLQQALAALDAKRAPAEAGDQPSEVAAELADLEQRRQLAAERFELSLEAQRVLKEQAATLHEKLGHDREVLARLLGKVEIPEPPVPPPASPPPASPPPAESAPIAAPAAASATAPPTPPVETPPAAATPALPGLAGAVLKAAGSASEATAVAALPAPKETKRHKRLVAAEAEAGEKEALAKAAEERARDLATRTAILQREIGQERQLLDNARKRVDIADQTVRRLEDDLHAQLLSGDDPALLKSLGQQITESTKLAREARIKGRDHAMELDRLQSQLAELQAEEIAALREAEALRQEADTARQRVENLRNPFAPLNVLQWLLDHGPTVAAILLAMGGFVWGSRGLQERIVQLVCARTSRGTDEDHENRARTLVGVFRYAANVVIVLGGTLMVLDEVGISIAPLMGGAAVLGLAVAFGAQSLIKDYFAGFMILLEQQYLVNDVIRVCGVEGQVERITLRVTVIRDIEGRVHFVPHGEITSTTNLTHGWSRALFDVGVSYGEDVDRVIQVLEELANQLRQDPEYGPLILEAPTMLGVEAFGDSSVTVRFFLKTRPLRQWPVKRELLRRIKRRFDELGIEIPYPQRTVHVRAVPAPGAAAGPPDGAGPAAWVSAPAA